VLALSKMISVSSTKISFVGFFRLVSSSNLLRFVGLFCRLEIKFRGIILNFFFFLSLLYQIDLVVLVGALAENGYLVKVRTKFSVARGY
jgi:hypothetical protein